MNNRIKEIRKSKGLSQEKFGKQLGVTKTSISKMELGTYNVTDTMIKLICTEFNVNEEWLRYGKGEMFIENDSTIISALSTKYNLNSLDEKIIESYLNLTSEQRKAIQSYVCSLANVIVNNEITVAKETVLSGESSKKDVLQIQDDSIEKELNAYRLELEAEKKGKISSVSEDIKEKLG
ncbi:helix-turn-helix domain-containing protein [Tissierella sp. MSJ-40]|uniref:Helix-turn-helix domain-containing protein n=1 Tax=Tissierella simiarum TaxID=2841534 RepID=A0ABS6E663_9FIRM|nr:helix-turn-helix domain-containing protein [Tissierella simiarum]